MMMNQHQKLINLLLFGKTRTGKSSMIYTISGQNEDYKNMIGTYGGKSTTTKIKPYQIAYEDTLFIFWDTMGLCDTECRFQKKIDKIPEILLNESIEQNKNLSELDAILVFESLNESSISLKISLEQILKSFSYDKKILKSIIIIVTHCDLEEKYKLQDETEFLLGLTQKKLQITEIAQEYEINNIIYWKNKTIIKNQPSKFQFLNEEELALQMNELKNKIQLVQKYSYQYVNQAYEEILTAAQQIQIDECFEKDILITKNQEVEFSFTTDEVVLNTQQEQIHKDFKRNLFTYTGILSPFTALWSILSNKINCRKEIKEINHVQKTVSQQVETVNKVGKEQIMRCEIEYYISRLFKNKKMELKRELKKKANNEINNQLDNQQNNQSNNQINNENNKEISNKLDSQQNGE